MYLNIILKYRLISIEMGYFPNVSENRHVKGSGQSIVSLPTSYLTFHSHLCSESINIVNQGISFYVTW